MPFLLAEILNFQGSTHRIGVGSFSKLDVERQKKIYSDTIPLDTGLKEAAKWYDEHETEVNKKPYFQYIDANFS